jgi:hypothetical protein
MSRRSRSSRRRTYGKRQHDVRERRPTDAPETDWPRREDGWAAPQVTDDAAQRQVARGAATGGGASHESLEGWAP